LIRSHVPQSDAASQRLHSLTPAPAMSVPSNDRLPVIFNPLIGRQISVLGKHILHIGCAENDLQNMLPQAIIAARI
jgi:hypothetical protein